MRNKPLDELTGADEAEQSDLERAFVTHWKRFSDGAPDPVCEYRFHDVRKFRFDFAWPAHQVAVECQGIRDHASVKGMTRDCAKMNLAQVCGWMVFQATGEMLERNPSGFVVMVVDALAVTEVKARNANLAGQRANAAADGRRCDAMRGT